MFFIATTELPPNRAAILYEITGEIALYRWTHKTPKRWHKWLLYLHRE